MLTKEEVIRKVTYMFDESLTDDNIKDYLDIIKTLSSKIEIIYDRKNK